MALGLAEAGSDLVLCSRSREELEEVATEARKLGGRALVTTCDVTDSNQITAAVDAAIQEYGRIDVLINNAGLTIKRLAEKLPLEDWQTIINVNLTGVFLMAQAVTGETVMVDGGWTAYGF